jgi:hypothetical protein
MASLVNVKTQHILKEGIVSSSQLAHLWVKYSSDVQEQFVRILEGFGIIFILSNFSEERFRIFRETQTPERSLLAPPSILSPRKSPPKTITKSSAEHVDSSSVPRTTDWIHSIPSSSSSSNPLAFSISTLSRPPPTSESFSSANVDVNRNPPEHSSSEPKSNPLSHSLPGFHSAFSRPHSPRKNQSRKRLIGNRSQDPRADESEPSFTATSESRPALRKAESAVSDDSRNPFALSSVSPSSSSLFSSSSLPSSSSSSSISNPLSSSAPLAITLSSLSRPQEMQILIPCLLPSNCEFGRSMWSRPFEGTSFYRIYRFRFLPLGNSIIYLFVLLTEFLFSFLL